MLVRDTNQMKPLALKNLLRYFFLALATFAIAFGVFLLTSPWQGQQIDTRYSWVPMFLAVVIIFPPSVVWLRAYQQLGNSITPKVLRDAWMLALVYLCLPLGIVAEKLADHFFGAWMLAKYWPIWLLAVLIPAANVTGRFLTSRLCYPDSATE